MANGMTGETLHGLAYIVCLTGERWHELTTCGQRKWERLAAAVGALYGRDDESLSEAVGRMTPAERRSLADNVAVRFNKQYSDEVEAIVFATLDALRCRADIGEGQAR